MCPPTAVHRADGDLAGLYIHVPFCRSVCPYCDFAVTIAGEDRRRAYVAALIAEAELVGWDGPNFDTVYLGGGTPSSLEPEQLESMLTGVLRALPVEHGARLSLEVNPEDVTTRRAAGWRAIGVSAVSLGVQSLDDRDLAFLGRGHGANAARRALEVLIAGGFDTVAADLIFGLPGQTAGGWRSQLVELADSGVGHLSCYQLTIHARTVFGRRAAEDLLHEAPVDVQAELYEVACSVLADRGWEHYEVSNWAAEPGQRSRHNHKYWRHVPYLGLGPSSHSYLDRRRWWNHRKLRVWQSAVVNRLHPIDGDELLEDADLLLERVMLGMRTSDGVDLVGLLRQFNSDVIAANGDLLEDLEARGLVWMRGGRLGPTERGMAVAEALVRSIDLPQGDLGGDVTRRRRP